MRITLDVDQVALLQAVAAGRVARHRLRATETAASGRDYEHRPDQVLASDYRRVHAPMRRLADLNLVALIPGSSDAMSWPYATTPAGDTVLEHVREQAETSTEEIDR